MTVPQSEAMRILKSIDTRKFPKELPQNVAELNRAVNVLTQYQIVMQKGIDDANKDIIAKIQDFIEEVIILFTGGADALDFDWGDLGILLRNLGNILGLGGIVDFIVDPLEWAVEFFDNIIKSPIVQSITDAINDFIYNLLMALDAVTLGVFNIDSLAQHFKNQAQSSAGTAAALTQLQNQLATGSSYEDTYDRPNSATLGNGWVQGGVGQGLGIIDNAARIDNTGTAAGMRWARAPLASPSSDFVVATVVNPAGVAQSAMTSLFLRANETLTEFVYANIYGKSCYIGRGTRSGDTWSFTDWKSDLNRGVSEGAQVEFSAEGTTYTLKVNGNTILQHTDVSGYPLDDSHHYYGFASETRVVGTGRQYSWGLATFVMRTLGGQTLSQVAETAETANQTAAAAADAVARLQEEVSGDGGNATTYQFSFSYPNQDGLPSPWVTDSPTRLCIENNAAWVKNTESGFYKAVYPTALPTDDVSVRATMYGAGSNSIAPAGLILRSNTDMSNGAVCLIYGEAIAIGRINFGASYKGDNLVFDQWSYNEVDVSAGANIEFKVVGNTYSVYMDGALIVAFTDISGTVTTGASKRYTGILATRGTNFFGSGVRSFGFYNFFAKDVSPGLLVGTGWKLARNGGGGIALPGSGYQLLGAGTYDVADKALNVTVYDLGRGWIRIHKTGWYMVRVRSQMSSSAGEDFVFRSLFHIAEPNGSVPGTFNLKEVGMENEGDRTFSCDLCCPVYLVEGQYVAPGVYQAGSNNVVGDALQTVTVFEGTLMGR